MPRLWWANHIAAEILAQRERTVQMVNESTSFSSYLETTFASNTNNIDLDTYLSGNDVYLHRFPESANFPYIAIKDERVVVYVKTTLSESPAPSQLVKSNTKNDLAGDETTIVLSTAA